MQICQKDRSNHNKHSAVHSKARLRGKHDSFAVRRSICDSQGRSAQKTLTGNLGMLKLEAKPDQTVVQVRDGESSPSKYQYFATQCGWRGR